MKTKRNSLIIKALEQGLEEQAKIFSIEVMNHFDHKTEQVTMEIIKVAFFNLGIIFDTIPGKKWYQIFSNNEEVRFINALKLIKREEH